jgi:hypothetical protein
LNPEPDCIADRIENIRFVSINRLYAPPVSDWGFTDRRMQESRLRRLFHADLAHRVSNRLPLQNFNLKLRYNLFRLLSDR